jgi:hypothetical protein
MPPVQQIAIAAAILFIASALVILGACWRSARSDRAKWK